MASDNEATCESDPNFAVICAFMEKFGTTCGLQNIDFLLLQEMLENTQEVPQDLIDLHIKLLRKSRKSVSNERWERAIIKFCHTFCSQDAWEIERFGYKKARLSSKIRVLKELLEMQFDYNTRFKAEINKMSAEELRSQPLGKDKQGHAYWYQDDINCQIRVYKEDPDEETWTLVAKDRDGLVALMNELSDGDSKISSESAINEEDSNSLAEKPIIDTGQVDSSSSESKKLSGDSDNSNEENISQLEEEEETSSKRRRESDEENEETKRPKLSEAIEEPLMLVKGEGAGEENKEVSPIVGEEIEEEVMIFTGEGSGRDCETGNEEKPSTSESKDAKSDSDFVSINDSKNCVNSSDVSSVKNPQYKLGTIIDTKTDNKFFNTVRSPTKKSRWDVETIIAKEAPPIEEIPKKPMFFFGPGCLQFKPAATVGFGQKVPQEKKNEDLDVLPTNAKGDIGYRIEENEETPKHHQDTVEPVPVVEETCVKKYAYVCGDGEENDNRKSEKNEETKVETKEETTVVDNNTVEGKEESVLHTKSDSICDVNNVETIAEEAKKEEIIVEPKKDDVETVQIEENRTTNEDKENEETVDLKKEDIEAVQIEENRTTNEVKQNEETVDSKSEDIEAVQTEESKTTNEDQQSVMVTEESSVEENLTESNNKDFKVIEEPEITNEESLSESKNEDIKLVESIDSNDKNLTESKSEDIVKEVEELKVHEPKNEDTVKTAEEIKSVDSVKLIEEPKVNENESLRESKNEEIFLITKTENEESAITESFSEQKSEKSAVKLQNEESKPLKVDEESTIQITNKLTDLPKEISEENEAKSLNVDKRENLIEAKTDDAVGVENVTKAVEKFDDKNVKNEEEITEIKPEIETHNKVNEEVKMEENSESKLEDVSKTLNSEETEDKIGVSSENAKNEEKVLLIETPKVDLQEEKLPIVENLKEATAPTTEDTLQPELKEEKALFVEKIPKLKLKEETPIVEKSLKPELKEDNATVIEEPSKPELKEENASTVEDLSKPELKEDNAAVIEEPSKQELKEENASIVEDLSKPELKEDNAAVIEESSKPELKEENAVVEETSKFESVQEQNKEEIEEKEQKGTANNKRGRKNNSSEALPEDEKKPRVTRRTTRSSKNGEKQTETVEELQAPTRRGRPRASQKTEKDENGKKMKMSEEIPEENEDVKEVSASSSPSAPETVIVESSSSSDIVEIQDADPLAEEEPKENKEEETKEKPMSLMNFSLDFTESPTPTPPVTRSGLRKRSRESPQNAEEIEETSGKRMKMKAKRTVDVKLRKSIEEQKKAELVSSDDDNKNEEKKKKPAKKNEESGEGEKEATEQSKKDKTKNKNKRLLSNLGIDPERALEIEENRTVGVRQSRRIAQLKIKEEAERRKLEEEMVQETHKKKKSKKHEDKDYKVEKKKLKNEVDDDDQEEDSADSKKKKKKKKKKHRKLFDEFNPWRSSSDSSSSEEEEEEEIAEEEEEELQYVSDHEFSPESDLEGDGEAQPLKRARTARKESDVEEVDDCPCQKCGKSDHPEWILLCDNCDNGWHCSCLRPPLLVIPEGDWFCPPCQHASLIEKLQEKLKEYDKKLNKKEIEDRRKQRLAYVGISLNSVLPTKDTENIKKRRLSIEDDDDDEDDDEVENDDDAEVGDEEDDDSSSEESESGSASESRTGSEDEPIYQLRQRRQAHSYRFNDYDELINSAIQDEMEAVKGAGNQGRGKDIATIVNAEKEEEMKKEEIEKEPPPPVVPVNDKDKEAKPVFSEDETIQSSRKKIIGRKKHRKLNSLDISSEDEDSDEDFKGTSSESDDDFDEDLGSEDSEDLDSGRNRRRGEVIRRSTRARTSRYDADFIDDGDSESEEEAPRRKKKRSIWDESESEEESDRSWGRRRKKPASRQKKTTTKKKSKKKKKSEDSDVEVYKKKKPKIKFGLDGEEGPGRRTRGKKINYVDALGSDSDEDRVKRPPPRIESEEEYVANEDEIDEDDKASEEEAEVKKPNTEKVQIQSYTDARFTQILPEPKNILQEDGESDLNPIDQINRNVEMMDENQMEKMMEEEEYANKQLQLVAQQLEKEKRRKEREAKKVEDSKMQFMQEPLVGNVIVNSENNDELSEPPGVSLPLFAELGGEEDAKKRRQVKNKKSLEETVANLGKESNIEIAAPPQPFSQSQPTPSVITRMLQSKPGQPGYPIGAIRPKQFAAMPEDDPHFGQGVRPPLSSPYRFNHYPPRNPPPLRAPLPPQMYHPHRPLDPSPSGGGTITMADHSPGRVVSPAAGSPGGKTETPPPPYSRAPVGRFPRHMQMVAPHLQPTRPNLSPYHPGVPPTYHYSQFGGQEDAAPMGVFQNSPYPPETTFEGVNPGENSNSKAFDEESGGEFGGLVSYFSSQREDDLES
ncbi:remodeling and spacing factor 1-like [Tribolium madens]|uniref:remodeling and spacing factor 1-like n=1 Tax=Tribolium madens TaxID=41895 RepID=UPI001CF72F47|nr:remodeling and spacing factor 1-like [Tribolium madens]